MDGDRTIPASSSRPATSPTPRRIPAPHAAERPADWTLNMLAQRRATHLLRHRGATRASSSRAVSGVMLVAVRSAMTATGQRWFLTAAETGLGSESRWQPHVLPDTDLD